MTQKSLLMENRLKINIRKLQKVDLNKKVENYKLKNHENI